MGEVAFFGLDSLNLMLSQSRLTLLIQLDPDQDININEKQFKKWGRSILFSEREGIFFCVASFGSKQTEIVYHKMNVNNSCIVISKKKKHSTLSATYFYFSAILPRLLVISLCFGSRTRDSTVLTVLKNIMYSKGFFCQKCARMIHKCTIDNFM